MLKKKKLRYSKIVIIVRENNPEIAAFEPGDEEKAEAYFDRASAQWSESFLCTVEKGPVV